MKFKNRRNWQVIKQFSIGWAVAFLFISFVRGEGTEELGSVQFELLDAFLVSILMGPVLGSISGLAQVLTEEYGYKQISLQKLLLLRAIFVILFLIFMILLAYAVYGENITLLEFAFEPGSFAIYFYIVFVDFFMVSLRLVNLYFGSNNLWKLFRGKYYTPREEERIFMFLDLQGSTEHAERLGHITYSKMIQDCFNDLGVVIENEAEIYQYVGDEVILTWKLKVGLRNQNCINAYYHFQKELHKKKEYYLEKYNCQPHFKAGVNEGLVTVTEIGKYKKEIAYHGDPINTAARIQGKCNELQRELLISENLKTKLAETDLTFEELGKIELRGKEKQVSLYAVHKKLKII